MLIVSLIHLRGNTNSNENIAEEFSLKESSLSSEFGTIEYTCTGNCYCLDSDRRFSAVVSRSFSVVVLALTSYSAFKKAQENFQEKCEVDLYDGCDHSQIRSEVDDCEEKDLRDEIMEVDEIEKNTKELKDYLYGAVRNGFMEEDNVMEWCFDQFDEYFGNVDKIKIPDELNCEEIVKEAIERHKEEQKTWNKETDNDRLETVFEELEEKGILARHNSMCCPKCSRHEMKKEMAEASDTKVKGYVFYSWNQVDSAVEGHSLGLCFGPRNTGGDDKEYENIGWIVDKVLKDHGFKTDWDGSSVSYLEIIDFVWRKRKDW